MKTIIILILALLSFNASAGTCESYRPYHSAGIMATPQHESCNCATCHNNGIYKGTPTTTCAACHVAGGRASTFKSAGHIPTTVACDSCHRSSSLAWTPTSMNHNATSATCETCHNGNYRSSGAKGKPSDHIPTTLTCSTCHRTSSWDADWKHQSVVAGTCATCHNGNIAKGKSTRHIPTTLTCDTCHLNYNDFAPAAMNHVGIVDNCESCHNGTIAIGKSATHPTTPATCTTCHSFGTWQCGEIDKPYQFAKYNWRESSCS
jgi:hypothetical protein